MTRFIVTALATTALAGCATHSQVAPVAEPVMAMPVVPESPPAPKPQYGSFGFDNAGMDSNVVPGNDFYGFANGSWAKNTPIPADKSNYGSFSILD